MKSKLLFYLIIDGTKEPKVSTDIQTFRIWMIILLQIHYFANIRLLKVWGAFNEKIWINTKLESLVLKQNLIKFYFASINIQ